jgi:hypothetical protein
MTGTLPVKVSGRISVDLLTKMRNVWGGLEQDGSIILFCDYAEENIPVGTVFSHVSDHEGHIVYAGKIILANVTQQFFYPWDQIPAGWKVISEFIFEEGVVPPVVNGLQEINDWIYVENFLVFRQSLKPADLR